MSVTRNSHEAGRTASAPPSPSNNRSQRPRPSIETRNLGVGCIVWLPSIGDDDDKNVHCIREPCCSNGALQKGGYDHPVVVLTVSRNSFGDKVCSIAMVTSKERNHRLDRIRISQETPAPQTYGGNNGSAELYLERGIMDKQSYVVLEHIFQVPASQLRLCSFRYGSRACDSRLCETSYTLLMEKLNLEPDRWVQTPLLENNRERPQEIRRQLYGEPSRSTQPAAGINPGSSSSHRHTERNTFPATDTFYRTAEVSRLQPTGQERQYDAHDLRSGYRTPGQSRYVSPANGNGDDGEFSFKRLAMLLAVGGFIWWRWRSKYRLLLAAGAYVCWHRWSK